MVWTLSGQNLKIVCLSGQKFTWQISHTRNIVVLSIFQKYFIIQFWKSFNQGDAE